MRVKDTANYIIHDEPEILGYGYKGLYKHFKYVKADAKQNPLLFLVILKTYQTYEVRFGSNNSRKE